jgi:HEPN domain-containing protein
MSANNSQSWLDIAEDDLASARKLALPPEPHWKTAVYHCQQAAEKAVKALLVQHDGILLKKLERHDIGLLVEQLGHYHGNVDDLKLSAEALSDFATMYRYPGSEVEPLTQDVVDKAIDDADLFIKKAKELLLSSHVKFRI